MKSITVTTYKSNNYGGVLQAYALQKFQEGLGINNLLLNTPWSNSNTLTSKNLKSICRELFFVVSSIIHKKENKLQIKNFQIFRENYLRCTPLYETNHELKTNPPEADYYITGSDQVFSIRSPYQYERLLDWVPHSKAKYSYAASLGEYDWSDEEAERFTTIISSFNGISVREEYAQELLSKLTNQNIRVNLDPVFLLERDEYESISVNPNVGEPYIFVYPLISNAGLQELIDKSRKYLNKKTVAVRKGTSAKYKFDKVIGGVGPREFLGLIKNSDAVLSTSFHGMAFAIIFHKPFYVMVKDYKSQRITNLLEKFGLSDRVFKPGNAVNFSVDFSQADEMIRKGKIDASSYFAEIERNAAYGR